MTESKIPRAVLCDIDGVLGDLAAPIVGAINDEFGTNHGREDWVSWEWPIERVMTLAGLSEREAAAWVFSFQHIGDSQPIAEAQIVLKAWADAGTDIHVATSRAPDRSSLTRDWLSANYPFISAENIHMRDESSPKGNAFKQQWAEILTPDMYFEDEGAWIEQLLTIWPEGAHSIINMIDQPWNRSYRQLDPLRARWSQFLK